MRAGIAAFLICTVVLVHEISCLQPIPKPNLGKLWFPAPLWDTLAVSTAKDLTASVLNLSNGQYWLYMDWAFGAWWNQWANRFIRYRYYFRIKNKSTKQWHMCAAQIAWPKSANKPFFDPPLPAPPGSFFNTCTPL